MQLAASPPSCPQQGNNGPPLPSLPACCMEMVVMVSFPLVFICSPPFHFFGSIFSFKLLFSRLHQPPLLPQSRELGHTTTIHAHLSHGEGGDSEFSSSFWFSTIPIFSHSIFFQFNCYSVAAMFCCFSFSFLDLHLNIRLSWSAKNCVYFC